MSTKENRNALLHGFYSSDVVLPWEREEDFYELLEGLRLDFRPNGTTEDEEVFGIAVLRWKKRRIHRALQLTFLESNSAAEIEKSGKRSVSGIRRHLKARDADNSRQAKQFTKSIAVLTEAVASLAEATQSNKLSGKFQANLRSVLDTIEDLRPHIDSQMKAQEAAEKISSDPYGLDNIAHACELEERLDALIEKKIKRLVMFREFQRQYRGHDSTVKVIEAQPVSAVRSGGKTNQLNAATSQKKKSTADDDRNSDSANDHDNNEYQLDRDLEA